MNNFDYYTFNEGYGLVFNAKKYTADEAREIAAEEFDRDITEVPEPEEIYVRYTINGGWEWDYQPCYITCSENERGSFRCWRIQ